MKIQKRKIPCKKLIFHPPKKKNRIQKNKSQQRLKDIVTSNLSSQLIVLFPIQPSNQTKPKKKKLCQTQAKNE
jgi:hypothetical protein